MPLPPIDAAKNLFIRRWGEMAANWGIGRTMAEIHALLYLTDRPLCMDEIMDRLQVSRGGASMNLRELEAWGLIERSHQRGDRKEYFDAEKDVWQMFQTIIRERRRREVQPIVETLQRCLSLLADEKRSTKAENRDDAESCAIRFRNILEFCELMNTLVAGLTAAGKSGIQPIAELFEKAAG